MIYNLEMQNVIWQAVNDAERAAHALGAKETAARLWHASDIIRQVRDCARMVEHMKHEHGDTATLWPYEHLLTGLFGVQVTISQKDPTK